MFKLLALALFLFMIPAASASEIVTRNAGKVSFIANRQSAQVGWNSGRMVACCAINAREPSQTIPQVKFKRTYGAKISGSCGRTSVRIDLQTKVCKAPDGSLWGLQKWERLWPNYGGNNAAQELVISHWKGALPVFEEVRWEEKFNLPVLCGKFTYQGNPVYGFTSTRTGVPTDTYGRLVYLDAYNSDYGSGWRRVNSFLTHTGTGEFCYIFALHNGGHGIGEKYRITANGPGVTPVVRMQISPPLLRYRLSMLY